MGRKQKLKKDAKAAAKASAAENAKTSLVSLKNDIKALSDALAAKEKTSEEDPTPGCSQERSQSKDAMDPGYRKKLKKLMDLAQKVPNVLTLPDKLVTVEDCNENDQSTDSDDEAPDLVDPNLEDFSSLGALRSSDCPRQSRGEKKARRILMKMDLKPVENVVRVTMKKSKNFLLYIDNPEVFKVAHSETYICFGPVRVEDISTSAAASQAAAKAAERFRTSSNSGGAEDGKGENQAEGSPADDDEAEELDKEVTKDLDEKDIELVQMQAACSRNKAIKALLMNDNDVVNAIMALTVG
ncbi:LOW QUALITY PROTEIN: nascent polypeptide-associated complex subunit alpha [Drosophila eugracilis]|uniref:LOW QUALITY PROTEIN: nascent polypeptide-associated complex subunit alpha n=1 Tax=Drosophila eugracilis TaxID=29029 RepID=UPI001BDACEB1|nr:LOW QUALITY PROTEIN: nascent polypeptide-associated complex subunit alpha [Drosophila eugracilis]